MRREGSRVNTERLEKVTFEHGTRMRSRPSALGVAVTCDRLPSADDIKCIVHTMGCLSGLRLLNDRQVAGAGRRSALGGKAVALAVARARRADRGPGAKCPATGVTVHLHAMVAKRAVI
jgi:hypothetical protein